MGQGVSFICQTNRRSRETRFIEVYEKCTNSCLIGRSEFCAGSFSLQGAMASEEIDWASADWFSQGLE